MCVHSKHIVPFIHHHSNSSDCSLSDLVEGLRGFHRPQLRWYDRQLICSEEASSSRFHIFPSLLYHCLLTSHCLLASNPVRFCDPMGSGGFYISSAASGPKHSHRPRAAYLSQWRGKRPWPINAPLSVRCTRTNKRSLSSSLSADDLVIVNTGRSG